MLKVVWDCLILVVHLSYMCMYLLVYVPRSVLLVLCYVCTVIIVLHLSPSGFCLHWLVWFTASQQPVSLNTDQYILTSDQH